MTKLNIGCGKRPTPGWVNLDIEDFGQEVVRDICRGLPFADDTFDEVMADNVMEHIKPGADSVFVMNELYRVCRPGAVVTIIVPHAFSQGAHQDPTHCNYFVPRSALYWNLDLPWPAMYGSTANFDICKVEITGDPQAEAFITYTLKARTKVLGKRIVSANGQGCVEEFHRAYYASQVWRQTFYRGIQTAKCPLDLWVYGEILHELQPMTIIETGTYKGGSALFLADHSEAQVFTIDITDPATLDDKIAHHPRICAVSCNSAEWRCGMPVDPLLVILDSDHSAGHVLKELELYAPLVTVGSYLIVEDTNVGLVAPELLPGPAEALAEWLPKHPEFEVDRSREKFMLSFNLGGYLRRVR